MTNQTISTLREFKILASQQTKGVQWPTIAFSVFVISATLITTYLTLQGFIPLWVGCLLNGFWMTQGYTAVHECAHQGINGRHQHLRWLNEVFGIAGFFFTMHSFALHKHVHRLHHSHTNDLTKDTDAFVSSAPNALAAIPRAFIFLFYTNYFMFKIIPLAPNPRRLAIRVFIETLVPVGLAIWLALSGFALEVLVLWFIPAIIAFAGVSFFVDWIPHHVTEEDKDPMKNTIIMEAPKTLAGRLFAWVYNFHNYHLIHHLTPSVPWYEVEKVYESSKDVLKNEGAAIKFESGLFKQNV